MARSRRSNDQQIGSAFQILETIAVARITTRQRNAMNEEDNQIRPHTVANRRSMQLWEATFGNSTDSELRVPYQYPPLNANCLLFVGLNPSFRKQCEASANGVDYRWSQRAQFSSDKAQEDEREHRHGNQYYTAFRKVSEALGRAWEHIDLFFIRSTKQTEVKCYLQASREDLSDFAQRQLEITKYLLSALKPIGLVIANAYAADIFIRSFGPRMDTKLGCYFCTGVLESRVPVFPASMLSGQRALDKYSRERLVWHINHVLRML